MVENNLKIKKSRQNDTKRTKRTFNEWVDMVFNSVEESNKRRYGFNTTSTAQV